LGTAPILPLLLYFNGLLEMRRSLQLLTLPALVVLLVVLVWSRQRQAEVYDRMRSGMWGGAVATLAYDLVRVPMTWAGIPVFKAISYFGTVILGHPMPTLTSEVLGWLYHLSNGVGFGMMYAALVIQPRWWSAVLWGVSLELLMLLTPYAEVFGYKVNSEFLGMTIGAHVVYGLTLWVTLRGWLAGHRFGVLRTLPWRRIALLTSLIPVGLFTVATEFHRRFGLTLPPSPPTYVGPHLYTTWDVVDPDRLTALWVLQRFVDPEAQFHFVKPFSAITVGRPFDTPEAAIRRSSTQAATEVLIASANLHDDHLLAQLAQMGHLYEITPWRLPAHPRTQQLGQEILSVLKACVPSVSFRCLGPAFQYLDSWYESFKQRSRGRAG
jgi:hypothetical protein